MDLSFSALFSSLVISSIGMGLFMYGKRAERPVPMCAGLAMCVYPYFISSVPILWLVTIGLCIPIWRCRHA